MNSEENFRDIILLNRNSNIAMFCKKKLVAKVFNSEDSVIVGINRDGNLKSNKKCTIPLFERIIGSIKT